ncbi:MAG: glycosyltransferase family 1 protein [Pseudomonadota bacterium]
MSAEPLLWINARFLGRPVTGVERVAREILEVIAHDYVDHEGLLHIDGRRWRPRLIAPRSVRCDSPWPNLPLVRIGPGNGHMWEQTTLALCTAGDWLLNLCNTGPVFKRRQISFLHDAQPFAIPENFSFAFRAWYRWLYRLQSRNAYRIAVNSRFTAGELARHIGLDPGKTVLCPLGVDHAEGILDELSEERHASLPEGPFLLVVSSSSPNKNIGGVMAALAELGEKAPPCVMVGQLDQRHFASVSLNPELIHHLGYVSDAVLKKLYRHASGLVFPSYYEGFGLPPLEAMAHGCPVIVSNCSAMPEVCGDAAIYCDPSRPASIANAIAGLLQEERPERRRTAVQQHARRYSWSHAASNLINTLP